MRPILSFRQNYFILCKPTHIIQIYQKTRMRFAKSYLIQFLLPILQLSLHFIPGILCAYVHTTPLILNHNNVCFPTDNRLSILHNCDFGIRIPTRFENVDIVTFRENTEDLYVGKEEQIDENTVYAYKIITKKASTRIIKAAFEYCVKHNRKKLTCVHKANILKMSDGLFLHIFEDIAKDYPQIEANSLIVDNTCMQLVMHPEQFDVMVMPNLYGDIVSDLTSGLIGGLGLLPSCNKGDEYAMYEAVHGSAPDIAGKHIANPSALLLSACMMLDDLHQDVVSSKIRKALNKVFEEHSVLTPDLGGNATTEQFTDEIIKNL